jgi:hypothetical protein
MRKGGGGAKGAEFERVICKHLSLWLSRGMRDDLFWRTAMSGGRATVRIRQGKINRSQCGDIGAIDAQGERLTNLFFIDTKRHRDVNMRSMLYPLRIYKGPGNVSRLWSDCCADAHEAKRLPLLIVQENTHSIFAFLNDDGSDELQVGETEASAYFPIHGALVFDWLHLLTVARRP